MLWQGQEFADNYVVASGGNARVSVTRDVHWEYFYDPAGRSLVRLYRRLGRMRRTHRSFTRGDFYYHNEVSDPGARAIVYHRSVSAGDGAPAETAVVALNFSDQARTLDVPFPRAGTYRELLDADQRPPGQPFEVVAAHDGERHTLTVPSNYGLIFVSP